MMTVWPFFALSWSSGPDMMALATWVVKQAAFTMTKNLVVMRGLLMYFSQLSTLAMQRGDM